MKTVTISRARTVLLTAPGSGPVRLCAPRALCGELQVFERGETMALVDGQPVGAPGHGFVVRVFTRDGDFASDGMPLIEFRIA